MNIEDMILVIDNSGGKETNFLCTFPEYLKTILLPQYPEAETMAVAVSELFMTRKSEKDWSEVLILSNHAVYARFCKDLDQLRYFLWGRMNEDRGTDKEWCFVVYRCSTECLNFLKYRGLTVEGKPRYGEYTYQEAKGHLFYDDDIIEDFNGYKYKIVEGLSEEDFVIMSLDSGAFSLAEGLRMYYRFPMDEKIKPEEIVFGVTWNMNRHLSWKPTGINMAEIKANYESRKEEKTCKVR